MRNLRLDALRGLAIILVVLGHAVQFSMVDFDNSRLFEWIYSFHMPLFMFISGYATYKEDRAMDRMWLKKKAGAYLLPFAVWSVLPYMLPENTRSLRDILIRIKDIVKDPGNGYWFLWILFLNCIFLFAFKKIIEICKLEKYEGVLILAGGVLLRRVILKSAISRYLGLSLVAWYIIFYLGGYLCKKYSPHLQWLKRKGIALILCTVFLMLSLLWRRMEEPIYNLIIKDYIHNATFATWICQILTFAVPFLGIYSMHIFIRMLPDLFIKGLAVLGRYTLEIYILHGYYLTNWIGFSDLRLIIFGRFVSGLAISLFAAVLINKGYLSKIIFGKNQQTGKFVETSNIRQ